LFSLALSLDLIFIRMSFSEIKDFFFLNSSHSFLVSFKIPIKLQAEIKISLSLLLPLLAFS